VDNIQDIQKEEKIDIRTTFFKFLSIWYIFVITAFISLAVAYYVSKFQKSKYMVTSTLLISDNSWNKMGGKAQFMEAYGLFSDYKNFDNEIAILQSNTLRQKAISNMDIKLSYFSEGKYITTDIYNASPFTVAFDSLHIQPLGVKFFITFLSPSSVNIKAQGENISLYSYTDAKVLKVIDKLNIDKKVAIGETYFSPNFNFKILLNPNFDKGMIGQRYSFTFNDPDNVNIPPSK